MLVLVQLLQTHIATKLPLAGGTMTGALVVNTAGNGLPSVSLSHSNASADNFLITAGVPGTSNAGFSIRDVDAAVNRLVIDTSGNVLISKTAANTTAAGNVFFDYGRHAITVNATTCQVINRLGNDGTFTVFQKDNTNVGQIDVLGGNNLTISGSAANHAGFSFATNAILPAVVGATNSGVVDLGATSEKFKALHLSGTVSSGGLSVNSGSTNVVATLTSTDQVAAIQFTDSGGSAEIGCDGSDVVLFPAGTEKFRVQNSNRLFSCTISITSKD